MEEKKTKKVMGPILGWILFTGLGCFLFMWFGLFPGIFYGIATGGNQIQAANVSSIIVMLIYLLIYYLSNKKTFDGCLRGYNFGIGFMLFIPWAILAIVNIIIAVTSGDYKLGLTMDSFLVALRAGICEEIAFRAIPAAHMMRCYKDEKDVMKVAILTSVAFAFPHIVNLFVSADPVFTVIQIAFAFALGMLLCASYLRSGSILPAIIVHLLNDVAAFLNQSTYNQSGIMENVSALDAKSWIINGSAIVIYLIVAIYALRPAKRGEIIDIWAKKWKKAE